MKKTAFIFTLMTNLLFGQEMFNNGGFENYSSCPTGWDQTLKITGCSGRNGSPEYYNCSYGPNNAYSGTGSVYLGAIRNGASSFTEEGINLLLTTPLTAGTSYTVSIKVRYGVTVYGDPSFDPSIPLTCFNLRFVFANGNQSGRPTVFHAELDGGAIYGNGNSSYHEYSFTFTPTQNYTHLYMITASSDSNSPGTTNVSCTSVGSLAYVYFNYIDDLSILPLSILPIQLTKLDCIQENKIINIYWETLSETNNKLFEIERSDDGENWSKIGSVEGAGNSSEKINYSFIDDDPIFNLSYYRLKQIDFDSRSVYSEVVKANYKLKQQSTIFPNPNNGKFTFRIHQDELKEVSLIVYSISGDHVFETEIFQEETKFDLSYLCQGIYFYSISTSKGIQTGKFSVE